MDDSLVMVVYFIHVMFFKIGYPRMLDSSSLLGCLGGDVLARGAVEGSGDLYATKVLVCDPRSVNLSKLLLIS